MKRQMHAKRADGGIQSYYVLHVNPEPWAIGNINYKTISPNLTLKAFQEAVREEMEGVTPMPSGEYVLRFYFWRQMVRYIDMNDKLKQRHQADATNMQKALEDALQGVLFDNDRNVREISSVIVSQSPDTEPRIVIVAATHAIASKLNLPWQVHEWLAEPTVAPPSDNTWHGPSGWPASSEEAHLRGISDY